MKVVKIESLNKEVVIKFNIGILKRSAKVLGVKTPEVFSALESMDAVVGAIVLGESIKATEKTFDVGIIDELPFSEFMELMQILMDEIVDGLPNQNGQAVKKKK